MGIYISRIGAISKDGTVNKVNLTQGLNLIIGDSQTGKSALIEIVDYCLLNSKYNIPVGIISQKCEIFFIVLIKNNKKIIIGRENNKISNERNGKSKAFLKYEKYEFDEDNIDINYFYKNERNFKPIKEVKVDFLEIFNFNVLEKTTFDNETKRPTHRNIVSFIFQTQGIIASKENLFYRENDIKKRKSIIEELPILLGLVDQEYNLKRLKKADLEKEIKKMEKEISYSLEEEKELKSQIQLKEDEIKSFTTEYKTIILDENIRVNIIKQKKELEEKLTDKGNKLLDVQFRLGELGDINIKKIELKEKVDNRIKNDFNFVSNCPFCNSELKELNKEIENLQKIKKDYINFISKDSILNATLLKRKMSLEKEKKELEKEIAIVKKEDLQLSKILNEEENSSEKIREHIESKKIYLNAIKKRMEDININKLKESLKNLKNELSEVDSDLTKVNVLDKLKRINVEIAQEMERIISKLDFEETLGHDQININLEKLEYYHMKNNEKIYLKSMGSASNWLAVHIALFLAINYICSKYSNEITIPNILFLDQPSQTYFPAKTDLNNIDKNSVDYKSVENIFIQILDYIEYTEYRTKEKPQIILIDHADNLNLGEKYKFEDYVRARWNKGNGFIKK